MALGAGHFALGGWLYFLTGILDILDGRVARATGRVSAGGAYFDSVIDRYAELVVFGGLAYFYRASWSLFVVLAASLGSVMVSYARARGEALGVDVKVGTMQRPERVFYLGLAMVVAPIGEALLGHGPLPPQALGGRRCLSWLAVSTNLTAATRIRQLPLRQLDQPTAATVEAPVHPRHAPRRPLELIARLPLKRAPCPSWSRRCSESSKGSLEYLPVSSTGHLILAGKLLGAEGEASKAFEIVIQLGAILAVLVHYRKLLGERAAGLLRGDEKARRLLAALALGFLPAAVVGVLLRKTIKAHLFGPGPVAGALIAGGVIMIVVELARRGRGKIGDDGLEHVTPMRGLLIGLGQCLSLWPGASRSMCTIVTGQLTGLSTATAPSSRFCSRFRRWARPPSTKAGKRGTSCSPPARWPRSWSVWWCRSSSPGR